jgi:class 3 adenylate cyclase/alpha-beta hydrolase superfamily lysophospholipase
MKAHIGSHLYPMADGEEIPETQFATLGDDRIAYQVFGEGDVDLIFASAMGDCIDLRWYWPPYVRFLRRLGAQARVIMFDRQGSGASDSPSGEVLPSWERWADEARVVLDAVTSEQAVILGSLDAGATAILFAASHPSRTRGLILANSTAHFAVDSNQRPIPEEISQFVQETWGTEALVEFGSPDAARDPAYRRWAAMNQRLSLHPKDARTILRFQASMDVRLSLTSVRVPTLVLHRKGYKAPTPDHGQYLADHIPGARLALVPGSDGTLYGEPSDEILRHIEQFLGGLHSTTEPDRALAAILFTDIVGSTERASALGDRAWRNLLETHDAVARTIVEQHRGKLVKMTGDGVLATFDGPGRAIRCAVALTDALRSIGLEIRAGLHTGEVEVLGADIAGIGVHIAARVLDAALPGDLLVSAAVPMLVAGSGFEFEDKGEHELKGIPGSWKLFAVKS